MTWLQLAIAALAVAEFLLFVYELRIHHKRRK